MSGVGVGGSYSVGDDQLARHAVAREGVAAGEVLRPEGGRLGRRAPAAHGVVEVPGGSRGYRFKDTVKGAKQKHKSSLTIKLLEESQNES